MKKQNGITLISLIITIIIMLILAGVSLSMVMGDSSMFEKANSATEQTKIAEVQEIVDLAIVNNKAAAYSKKDIQTKLKVAQSLYEQGKITLDEKNNLLTSDTLNINGTIIDFSEINTTANDAGLITTLAGTKWKMNETLTDYSFLGTFNYEEQTGWEDFPSGCMISSGDIEYEIWGLAKSVVFEEEIFGTVYSSSESYSIMWNPENDLGFDVGWMYCDDDTVVEFLTGTITDVNVLKEKIFVTEAPTITFSTESNTALENVNLIDWFYENGTML